MILPKGEIHLYCVSLNPSNVFFEKCKSALSEKEQERISYFKFPSVQKNFIMSQGALRLLLSDYLNIDAPKINIGKHSKGKPFAMDDTELCFNISNSGANVVFAFSRAGEVGIDIEKIRTLPDLDQLIEKNFSEKEKKFISKNPTEKEKRFFKFWTVKEAYLKAIGEGMRLSPDNLEFTFENNKYELDAIKGVFEQEDWSFTDFSIAADYAGTIVYKDKQTKISEIKFIN